MKALYLRSKGDPLISIRLDAECLKCGGTGVEEGQTGEIDVECSVCDGRRLVPTEAGQAILSLVGRYHG